VASRWTGCHDATAACCEFDVAQKSLVGPIAGRFRQIRGDGRGGGGVKDMGVKIEGLNCKSRKGMGPGRAVGQGRPCSKHGLRRGTQDVARVKEDQ
jgi:hypothetical protein